MLTDLTESERWKGPDLLLIPVYNLIYVIWRTDLSRATTFISFIQLSNCGLRALLRGPGVARELTLGFELTTFLSVVQELTH